MSGDSAGTEVESAWNSLHVVALCCAVVLVPLANLPDYLLWFDITPKVAILLAMVGLACLTVPSTSLQSTSRLKPILILPLAMVAAAILSAVFSLTPSLSLAGSSWRRFGLPAEIALTAFMILVTLSALTKPRRIIWYLRGSCFALLVASLAVILQAVGADIPFFQEAQIDTVRPGGFLGSGPAFGCYATAPFFLCASLWLLDHSRIWRGLAQAAASMAAAAILLCGTRAAVLGILLGLLVSLVLVRRHAWRIFTFACLTVAAAWAGIVLGAFAPLVRRLEQIQSDPWGATRLFIWRDSLALFPNLPVFGYGLESFPRLYPKVQSQQTALLWPNAFHESANNYLLDILLTKGLLGLVVVIAVSSSAIFAFRQLSGESKGPGAFYLAGHVACLTSCMFFVPQVPTVVSMYLPICLLWASSKENGSATNPPTRTLQHGLKTSWAGLGQRILTRALGAGLIAYASSLLFWDSQVYRTKLLFDSGQVSAAAEAFSRARRVAPPRVSAEGWFSRELISSSAFNSAQVQVPELHASLAAAVGHEEDPGTSSLLLAATMITEGRNGEAKAVLRGIVAENPTWPLPKELMNLLGSEPE